MFSKKLTTISVDFDALADTDPRVLRSQASAPLSEEQRVLLKDHQGRQVEAVVTNLEGNQVGVGIDWNTWATVLEKDLGDTIGLVVALICVIVIGVALALLIHNIWIGVLVAVVALVIVLMHQ